MNFKNLNTNKVYLIIKYTLIIILISLVAYTSFISYKLTSKTYPPKNSLEVSPLTGKSLMAVNSDNIIYNIKYKGSNIFDLYKIYDNDIVYEIYNPKTEKLRYEASSMKNIGSHESITPLDSNTTTEFPNLSFINYSDMKNYNFENEKSDIFIEYGLSTSTTFIYTKGQYKYINTITQQDKHNESKSALTFTNIIIQFTDKNNPDSGEGLLFTGGHYKEISWHKNKFVFKNTNTPITLNRGNSIWIPLDISDKGNVVFN